MPNIIKKQSGTMPLPLILVMLGIISFLMITTIAPLKDKLLSILYPKPDSHASGTVYWSAGAEIGNLDVLDWKGTSEWQLNGGGGEYNSGNADSIISTDFARSGSKSAKMIWNGPHSDTSGTRLFRWAEARLHRGAYYSAWFYFPKNYTLTGDPADGKFWDIFQFKSRSTGGRVDPFWFITLQNATADASGSTMKPALDWWKSLCSLGVAGPHQGECGFKRYQPLQDVRVPVNKWVQIEAYLYQSKDFDGQLKIWLDGKLIFDQTNVKTGYSNCSFNAWCTSDEWSVNNYSDALTPTPAVIYVDDLKIADVSQSVIDQNPSPTMSATPLPSPLSQPATSPTATPAPSPSGTTDTVKPSVQITAPQNGLIVPRRTQFQVSAAASDNVGISKVEFYLNNKRICSDTAADYVCTLNSGPKQNVTHTVTAKAYDKSNNSTSTSITVTTQ